jgi:hypothetical protein
LRCGCWRFGIDQKTSKGRKSAGEVGELEKKECGEREIRTYDQELMSPLLLALEPTNLLYSILLPSDEDIRHRVFQPALSTLQ